MRHEFQEEVQISKLPGGNRLSMRHGPIDLIVEAFGEPVQIEKAYQQAAFAFESVLTDLVSELDLLRKPLGSLAPLFRGKVSTRMHQAARKLPKQLYATPMIAVAGSVADHILSAMLTNTTLDRAYVNNGGDIALHLSQHSLFDIGICGNIENRNVMSKARIHACDNVRGVATSGWRGRSHSLGIADAVTVLAKNAAMADAAATLIANAVDLPDHPSILRQPANELAPDSDLCALLVTVDVGVLSTTDAEHALGRGRKLAQSMIESGLISAAYASLQSNSFSLSFGHAQNEPDRQRSVEFGMLNKEVSCA